MPLSEMNNPLSPVKFLLVGFDGLRPGMVTPELMPRLHRHAAQGITFHNHRCTFPSETYINLPSLVTGSPPSRHGMIDEAVMPEPYFDDGALPLEPARLSRCGSSGSLVCVASVAGRDLSGRSISIDGNVETV